MPYVIRDYYDDGDYDELLFNSYADVERYFDENPQIIDRIDDGRAFFGETNDSKENVMARRTRKRAKYVIEDTYGAPQAGVEVIEFDEWWELEDYLDAHPDLMERIEQEYAWVGERNASRARRRVNASYKRRKKAVRYVVDKSLKDFDWWGGAADRASRFTYDELDQLDSALDDPGLWGSEPPDATAINDMMWFDTEYLLELLGYEDGYEELENRYAGRRANRRVAYATSINVIDTLTGSHQKLQTYFRESDGVWGWHLTSGGTPIIGKDGFANEQDAVDDFFERYDSDHLYKRNGSRRATRRRR